MLRRSSAAATPFFYFSSMSPPPPALTSHCYRAKSLANHQHQSRWMPHPTALVTPAIHHRCHRHHNMTYAYAPAHRLTRSYVHHLRSAIWRFSFFALLLEATFLLMLRLHGVGHTLCKIPVARILLGMYVFCVLAFAGPADTGRGCARLRVCHIHASCRRLTVHLGSIWAIGA